MRLYFIVLTVLSIYARLAVSSEMDEVEVTTTAGTIVGKTINVTRGTQSFKVSTFYGIPFAQPPIGNLRFKPPLDVKPWVGKRTAFTQPNSCYQFIMDFVNITFEIPNLSEDCLYLNVWVPKPVPEKAAVMVFIYGGAFSMGSMALLSFSTFVATQNVIVVAMNYRVSSLGFLYFGNEECPGNAGLWDQQLALKWVRDNIDRFGGDPNRVTLFGQSAGAGSTGHHLLNPNSQHLFRRAILQSGSPYSPWAADSQEVALKKAYDVSKAVGCTGSNKNELVQCLRDVDVEKLVEASAKLGNVITLNHVPVFDDKIVFENRRQTVQDLDKKEVIAGITNDDGAFLVTLLAYARQVKSDDIFQETLKQYVEVADKDLINSIRYYYKDHCNQTKKYREEISSAQLGRDYYFTCANTELLHQVSEAGFPTFAYQFNHRPLTAIAPDWVKADHGTEFAFLLGVGAPEEYELCDRLMNYWGCFAKSGDPNCKSHEQMNQAKTEVQIQTWPRYTTRKRERIEINLDSSTQAFGAVQEDQCAFWKHDYPILAKNSKK